MSDIRLFQITDSDVKELPSKSVSLEKSLQNLFERHLEIFLGVRFLSSEYGTGKTHGGRIDTLGLDEYGFPVIIEYKRTLNDNVINQGLFYLDWLMDHKGEFTLLVQKKLGQKVADTICWSNPRLICIAGDFTKYDEYAVQQIPRNIELFRYIQYGKDLLSLDLINRHKPEIKVFSNLITEKVQRLNTITTDKSPHDKILHSGSPNMDKIEICLSKTDVNNGHITIPTRFLELFPKKTVPRSHEKYLFILIADGQEYSTHIEGGNRLPGITRYFRNHRELKPGDTLQIGILEPMRECR